MRGCFSPSRSSSAIPAMPSRPAISPRNVHVGAYCGRYVIVVDDDIDVSNLDEVIWALITRSDPATSIDVIRGAWSTPLDPRIEPERKAIGDYTNSRAVIDACRPYHWRDKFPAVNMPTADERREALARFRASHEVMNNNNPQWPDLPYAAWSKSCETLQLWMQVAGKVILARTPLVNHWWNVTFHVTARGMAKRAIPYRGGVFDIVFDFIDHRLDIETSDGRRESLPLRPMAVAEFYAEFMGACNGSASMCGSRPRLARSKTASPSIRIARTRSTMPNTLRVSTRRWCNPRA